MAFNEKEQPAKIFCLLHQKTDCSCIAPVADSETLKMRLAHHIRLNNQINRFESREAERAKRDELTIIYESRLADLRDS
ncbi:MAG TPA: hypothetical protein VGC76_16570 [Pyrinomonadaceae bacterium]|jgi:hypothetical protein